MWRKTLGIVIEQHSHTDRIISVKLKQQNLTTLLMNVYCPCDYRNEESLLKYKSCMADISNILQEKNYDEVVISGDLNCDKNKGRFFVELHKMMRDFSLTAEDIAQLPTDSFTYVSSNSICSTSWLDHVIKSEGVNLANFKIMYGTTFCDHIPLYFEYPVYKYAASNDGNFNRKTDDFLVINWDQMSDENLHFYSEGLDFLSEDFFSSAISCKDVNCSKISHKRDLDEAYNFVIRCMRDASIEFSEKPAAFKNLQVTGWNELCKDTYQQARQAFVDWKINGKIRIGEKF